LDMPGNAASESADTSAFMGTDRPFPRADLSGCRFWCRRRALFAFCAPLAARLINFWLAEGTVCTGADGSRLELRANERNEHARQHL